LGKAIYLFRKSSEGLGLTIHDEVVLAESAKRKKLRGFPSEVAQVVQDFGTGVIFLALFLGSGREGLGDSKITVLLIGAGAFVVGWGLRWVMRRTNPEA